MPKNPFAMTEEENALYNAQAMSPFTTYMTGEASHPPIFKSFSNMAKQLPIRAPAAAPTEEEIAASVAATEPPMPIGGSASNRVESALAETPEEKGLKAKIQALYEQSRGAQMEGIAPLEKMYGEYGQTTETDLSPLLAGLDMLGGTNNSAKYKAPDSPDDVNYKKAVIGQMLQKAREGVTEADLKRLGQLAEEKSVSRQLEASARDQRAADSFGVKVLQAVEADRVVSKSTQMMAAATDLEELISSNNPIAHGSIPGFVARLTGEVGALTEGDKAPYGSSKQIQENLTQIFTTYADTGLLTPQNAAYLTGLSNTLKKSGTKKLIERKGKLLNQYALSQNRFGKDQLRGMIGLDQDEASLSTMTKPSKTPPTFKAYSGEK